MSRLPKTISVEKLDNSVLFTFAQNQHYLYDGTIEVPFNSLSIIAESEAITLRKSASNDIFISAPWQNFDINASNKEDVVDALTDILYDETGGGVSREEVEDMIDAATSGIPSSQTIEQLRNDVNTISGNVQTLSGEVATKADASDLQALSEKVDTKLDASAYTPTDLSEYWTSAQTKSYVDASTSGKADTSVVNQAINEVSAAILVVSGEVATKLDASAYTPTDLSEYWTSAETKNYVDGKVDDALDDYYDKDYVDAALADKLDASAYTPTDLSEYWTSAETKSYVDAATSGGSSVTVDSELDETSNNPVANSAVTNVIFDDEEVVARALNDLNDRLEVVESGGSVDLSEYWTSAQTKSYVDAATSGTPSSQTIEQLRTDVNTISGNVESLQGEFDDYKDIVDASFGTVYSVIDEKEEVVASALTQLNLRLNEDEEVTAAALNDLNDRIGSGGGALFVDFDDLIGNMNDEKWDELVNALQNKKPIFAFYDYSENNNTDAGQSPVDAYIYINQTEGEEAAEIVLRQLYSGGWYAVDIIKNGSEDYDVSDYGEDYQPMGNYQPLLQAGSGISIDSNNVISVTGGSSVTVDSAITSASTNAVENRAIYDKVTMEVGDPTIIEYDDVPVTATTSGSRYYKVEFNDELEYVTFTVEGLPDTIKLNGDTGQITYTSGGALPEGLVTDTRYQPEYGVGHEIAFSSDYNVTSAAANVPYVDIYVGHTGTSTEWVKDVVADLLDGMTVDTSLDSGSTNPVANSAITQAISAKADASTTYTKTEVNNLVNNKFWCGTQAQYDALATKENDVLYLIHE